MNLGGRLINIVLRFANLVGKFLLMMFLVKYLAVEDVGLYGLLASLISLFTLVIGGDFYIYAHREYFNGVKITDVITNQIIATLILYIIIIPAIVIYFLNSNIPKYYIYEFIALVILEHISAEIYRWYEVVGRPLTSSIILLIKSSLWVLIIVCIFLINNDLKKIEIVFLLWILGCVLSIIYGLVVVRRSIIIKFEKFDYKWIIKGFKLSVYFIVGTFALRMLFTLDRYAIERYINLHELGIYVFIMSISSTIMTFFDASIFSYNYPLLMKNVNKRKEFKEIIKELWIKVIVYGFIIMTGIYLTMPYVIKYIIKKQDYYNQNILLVTMFIFFIYSLTHIPNYILYALKKDKINILTNMLSIITMTCLLYYNKSHLDLLTVSIVLLISVTILLLSKQIFCFNLGENLT